jgi:hypothetical protein
VDFGPAAGAATTTFLCPEGAYVRAMGFKAGAWLESVDYIECFHPHDSKATTVKVKVGGGGTGKTLKVSRRQRRRAVVCCAMAVAACS